MAGFLVPQQRLAATLNPKQHTLLSLNPQPPNPTQNRMKLLANLDKAPDQPMP